MSTARLVEMVGPGPLRKTAFPMPIGASALLVFAAYYAGAKLGLALTFHPEPTSVLWPPNAILMGALVVAPARWWPALVLAAFPAHLLAELPAGVPAATVLCWFASNVSEALIGAACVRRLLGESPVFRTLRNAGIFLACVGLAAPFFSSFLDAAFVRATGWSQSEYAQLWRSRFFSNVLANVTIVPMIVAAHEVGRGALRALPRERIGEGLALLFGLATAGLFVFDSHLAGSASLPALLYLPLPFLLWAVLRFGPAGSTAAFMIVVFFAVWGAGHGRGPFAAMVSAGGVLPLQLFLTFIGSIVLILTAVIAEREASERRSHSSEHRFTTVFRLNPDAMAISRMADGRLIDVNERWLSLFGCTREEVVGRSVEELGLCGGDPAAMALTAAALAGQPEERDMLRGRELTLHTRGGGAVEAMVSTAAVDLEGMPCFVSIIRDVTELKRAVDLLRSSDERFQHVLKATNDVILDWDIAADALWWNANGDAFFGKAPSSGSCTLAWWDQLLHAEDRERVRAELLRLIELGGVAGDVEYRLRRVDGSYAYVHGRSLIVRDANGQALRMIGSLMDITDRKRAEEANLQLVHVSRLAVVGEMTASIAHEINQPLGAIMSNADSAEILLDREPIPVDELRQIIGDIRFDDMRAGEVIRHLRDLLRKRQLTMQPFDLNRAIGDILKLVSADLGRHRVVVETELGPLPIVNGDQVHVQQVVLNLIFNAVDAMAEVPPAQRRLRIRTKRSKAGGVEVSVSDSGHGIAADHAQRLFESFFTTKQQGMGLGLSIARSIVEAHGGSIWAETRSEGGASFRFFLPGPAARAESRDGQQ